MIHETRIRRLLPLVLVLHAACSGSADDARAQSTVRSACELLPAADLQHMIGGTVETEDMPNPTQNRSACAYFRLPIDEEFPSPDLEIQVLWSGGREAAMAEVEGSGSLERIDGLGDGAWLSSSTGQLSLLLVGDVLVEFHLALLPGAAGEMMAADRSPIRHRFEALARSVLSRL